MCRWICQRIDDLQLFDDRTRPAVSDDERQRIWMFRTNVDEMNVHAINLGDELRQGVQSRFDLAPIVIRLPVACELLHRRELHALSIVLHEFRRRPLGCLYTPAQFGEFRFRNIYVEGTDCVGVFLGDGCRPVDRCHGNRGGCESERYNGSSRGETSLSEDAWGEFNLFFCFQVSVCFGPRSEAIPASTSWKAAHGWASS